MIIGAAFADSEGWSNRPVLVTIKHPSVRVLQRSFLEPELWAMSGQNLAIAACAKRPLTPVTPPPEELGIVECRSLIGQDTVKASLEGDVPCRRCASLPPVLSTAVVLPTHRRRHQPGASSCGYAVTSGAKMASTRELSWCCCLGRSGRRLAMGQCLRLVGPRAFGALWGAGKTYQVFLSTNGVFRHRWG